MIGLLWGLNLVREKIINTLCVGCWQRPPPGDCVDGPAVLLMAAMVIQIVRCCRRPPELFEVSPAEEMK
jgi:hypothetical protein